jgi:hypothetical protein
MTFDTPSLWKNIVAFAVLFVKDLISTTEGKETEYFVINVNPVKRTLLSP